MQHPLQRAPRVGPGQRRHLGVWGWDGMGSSVSEAAGSVLFIFWVWRWWWRWWRSNPAKTTTTTTTTTTNLLRHALPAPRLDALLDAAVLRHPRQHLPSFVVDTGWYG